MSRQDKATTDRHAKILRELVKRPENKVCADCKRNDPRWASWNLGVFLCIRCSGIHRSMGTHISKVKSVDLDIWTPEQMQSIQKWGNRLANIYWEAHLKPGHIPPEHKIESFIRSKYDSRRWAMEGPPPTDPSVLDSTAPQPAEEPAPPPIAPPAAVAPQQIQAAPSTRQPQAHQLLSTKHANQAPPPAQPVAPAPAPAPQQPANDLFSLDFHSPAPNPAASTPVQNPAKGKQDIMSLFSAAPAVPPVANVWGQPAAPQQPQQHTSMMGNTGAGMWGTSSGWSAPQPQPTAFGGDLWGSTPAPAATSAPDPFGNVWGNSNPAPSGGSSDLFSNSNVGQKKDDVFGDLWGGFK